MKTIACLFASAIALAVLPASAAPTLKVGDPAPAIKVAKWFKGQPVESYDPSQIYVVEFWATWCGPCIKNIPHLTDLARKYEGKVRIVGVSIWEVEKTDHSKRLEQVGKFVTKMGDKMDYTVAADDNEGFMGKNWMEAAEEKGIPTAFIIGKDAKVAWIGYPWAMEEKLAQVVAGTLDTQLVLEEAAKKQAEKDQRAAQDALFEPTGKLTEAKSYQDALASLDKLEAEHPELATRIDVNRYQILLKFDDAGASKQAGKLLAGPLKDNYSALYTFCRDLTEPATRKGVDWDVTVALGKRAVELDKASASSLSVLGHAYFRQGDFPKAIETTQQAIKKAEETPEMDVRTIDYFKGRLKSYQNAAAKAAEAPAAK